MARFLSIAYGTERYPERVARRLRACNITTWIAAAVTFGFSGIQFTDPHSGSERAAILNACVGAVFVAIPLLHRWHPLAGVLTFIAVVFSAIVALTFIIGNGAGMYMYFLVASALSLLFVGIENIKLAGAIAATAGLLLVGVYLVGPHNGGRMSEAALTFSFVVTALANCLVLFIVVHYVVRQLAAAEARAEHEFQRSEALLANILPAGVAAKLKRGDKVVAERFAAASVLFADMEGFTARAADIEPDALVQFLNRVFSEIDALVARHGLEKIKTTGDAYMVVSGVPLSRPDHAQALAALALDIRAAAAQWTDPKGRAVPLRMGLASGPVVAGVVGTAKFFYDVWGDTVNTAARMESTGESGKIQLPHDLAVILEPHFELAERGTIEVRGKGSMRTAYLIGPRAAAI